MSNVGQTNNDNNNDKGDVVSPVADVARNYYSAVRTRTPIEPEFRYDKFPNFSTLPKALKMDFSRILNKPYFLKTITWATTNTVGNLSRIDIPSGIWINQLAKLPFQAATYYRAKVELILQTSGTPMHSGTLIASAAPIAPVATGFDSFKRNTRMAAPHVFMYANENTPVVLEVPFYVNSKLLGIDVAGTTSFPSDGAGDYSSVFIDVWNQLVAPTSGSTSVSVSVHVVFRELEFYCPHLEPEWVPLVAASSFVAEGFIDDMRNLGTKSIDNVFSSIRTCTGDLLDNAKLAANSGIGAAREWIRKYTGLHAPEIPYLEPRTAVTSKQNVNLVDAPSYFEKLDPYSGFTHIVDDYVFDTSIDEMALKEILNKPQYLGTFVVKASDTTGKLLWSRPITPLQETQTTPALEQITRTPASITAEASTNLMQTLALLSKYWRGSLKIHIQSNMSNFHFCKLILARNYSPDTKMLDNYPLYSDVTNLLTETMEFSAGGQVQTIELPYVSSLEQLPITTNWSNNPLTHGVYYIYLYQPLVTNGTVSSSVSFNVYISAGDDFDLMGYATLPLVQYYDKHYIPPASAKALEEDIAISKKPDPASAVTFFVAEATAANPVNNQEELSLQSHPRDNHINYDLRPIKSVREYIRRFNKLYSTRLDYTSSVELEGCRYISISEMLNLIPRSSSDTNPSSWGMYSNPLSIISGMFLGFTGGTKYKIQVTGVNIMEAWYVPPSTIISEAGIWKSTVPLLTTGTNTDLAILEQFKFPDYLQNPFIKPMPFYSTPTVTMERPNFSISTADTFISRGDAASETHSTLATTCIMEFEVPYMSPLRFVGSSNKSARVPYLTAAQNYFTGDMGHIVLRIAQPMDGAGYGSGAVLEVYAAVSDEARFGYQVYAPPVSTGSFASEGEIYQAIPSIDPTTALAPLATNVGAKACYYTAS